MKRKYDAVKVAGRVRCMSDGHHWFSVRYSVYSNGWFVKNIWREYSPSCGFLALGYAGTGWEAPKYLTDEADRQIGQMCRAGKFTVYECDRDGNERTEDLRYHDPETFRWLGEAYK